MNITRRDLLKTAVVLTACGNDKVDVLAGDDPGIDQSEVRYRSGDAITALAESDDFPLSVGSGEVLPTEASLWTRYDGPGDITAYVWDDTQIVYRKTRVSDQFAKVHAGNLEPGKRYQFAFVAGRKRSAVGHFRAAIDPDSNEVVTFAGFACTHMRRAPFPALSHMALREDLDFWVVGGDKVYCDNLDGTQASYRAAYEATYKTAGYRALHPSASSYGMWDDHEFNDNFNAEKTDPAITALAKQTYFEHHPIRAGKLYRSFRWGKTLELFLIDCRGERIPSQDIYISREQMDWLKQGLSDSQCAFKMIVNGVPIADFPLPYDFKSYDRWQGFKDQRNEILAHCDGISNVWWLSGDFHHSAVGRVTKTSKQREILWGPGGNRANPLWRMLDEPQWDFASGDCSYTVLRCDPLSMKVRVSVVNDQGETLFDREL